MCTYVCMTHEAAAAERQTNRCLQNLNPKQDHIQSIKQKQNKDSLQMLEHIHVHLLCIR